MTFKNHFNATPSAGEINTQPSKTRPNQSMTIPEILRRQAAGLPVQAANREPLFFGDMYTADFEKMDRVEKMQYYIELRRQQDDKKAEFASKQTDLAKRHKELELIAIEYDKLKKEQKQAALFNPDESGTKADAKKVP